MSGLEPLAALSVACSVMQVISFTKEVAIACKHISRGTIPQKSIADYNDRANDIFERVERALDGEELGPQQQLLRIARECMSSSEELRECFAPLMPLQSHKGLSARLHVVRSATKAIRLRPKVDQAFEMLQKQQMLLQTGLLAELCSQKQAQNLRMEQVFTSLNQHLRHVVIQRANGESDVDQLLTTEAKDLSNPVDFTTDLIRDDISRTAMDTQNIVIGHIDHVEQDKAEAARRARFLESLRFDDMHARKNRIEQPVDGTVNWALYGKQKRLISLPQRLSARLPRPRHQDWDKLRDWLGSPGNLFWISGKPASGKSCLTRFIALHTTTMVLLQKWHQKILILYHPFWSPGTLMQRNIKGMLQSILWQILQEDTKLLDLILDRQMPRPFGLDEKRTSDDWCASELEDLLIKAMAKSPKYFCLFLDGLDEIRQDESARRSWKSVINKLLVLPNVKVCASSRPEGPFEAYFESRGAPKIRMQDMNYDDIREIVKALLKEGLQEFAEDSRESYTMSGELVDLQNEITQRAEGIILWAILATKSICEGRVNEDDVDEMRQRLDMLPSDLTELYKNMWSRLGPRPDLYRVAAAKYLRLIIDDPGTALPALMLASDDKLDDIFQAVKTQGVKFDAKTIAHMSRLFSCGEQRIRSRCAGLLEANPGHVIWHLKKEYASEFKQYWSTSVDFIHRTARDFVVDTDYGKEILESCDWTQESATTRLGVAVLVLSRMHADICFIHRRPMGVIFVPRPSTWVKWFHFHSNRDEGLPEELREQFNEWESTHVIPLDAGKTSLTWRENFYYLALFGRPLSVLRCMKVATVQDLSNSVALLIRGCLCHHSSASDPAKSEDLQMLNTVLRQLALTDLSVCSEALRAHLKGLLVSFLVHTAVFDFLTQLRGHPLAVWEDHKNMFSELLQRVAEICPGVLARIPMSRFALAFDLSLAREDGHFIVYNVTSIESPEPSTGAIITFDYNWVLDWLLGDALDWIRTPINVDKSIVQVPLTWGKPPSKYALKRRRQDKNSASTSTCCWEEVFRQPELETLEKALHSVLMGRPDRRRTPDEVSVANILHKNSACIHPWLDSQIGRVSLFRHTCFPDLEPFHIGEQPLAAASPATTDLLVARDEGKWEVTR